MKLGKYISDKKKELSKNLDKNKKEIKKSFKGKKSKFESSEVVILLVLTMLISVFVTSAANFGINNGRVQKVDEVEQSEELKNFLRNYNFIVENYYGDVNESEVLNEATRSILEALGDPFSNMIDAPSVQDTYLQGKFSGLGVEIINNPDGDILILRTFEGSPARKAGLNGGEIMISIDDVNLKGEDSEVLVDYVANNEGPFTVVVERDGEEEEYQISKELVIIPSVYLEMMNDGENRVGYMKIDIFSETTLDQFKDKLNKLENENISDLIIDLRGNSGGHLSVVEKMTALLLEEGMTVYKTDDSETVEEVKAKGGEIRDYEIHFLSNQASASASELMMGSLRDNIGSKIYGETTYGKGTVQQIKESSEGSTYTITIKRWLLPSGDWVQEGGLVPDHEIRTNVEYYQTGQLSDDNLLLEVLKKINN